MAEYQSGPWRYRSYLKDVLWEPEPRVIKVMGRYWVHELAHQDGEFTRYMEFDDGAEMTERSFRFLVEFSFPRPRDLNIWVRYSNLIIAKLDEYREDNNLRTLDEFLTAMRLSEFLERNGIPTFSEVIKHLES